MAGGIIIGDVLAPFPSLKRIPERVMLLKDLKTRRGSGRGPRSQWPHNANNQRSVQARLNMRPGQLEFWRIGNQSSNIFYQISLGDQSFHIVAADGNLQNSRSTTKTLLLPPGSRLEVLVYGPPSGTYQLQDAQFQHRPGGRPIPRPVAHDRRLPGIAGRPSYPDPAAIGLPQAAGPAQGEDRSAIGPSSSPTPRTQSCFISMASPIARTV